MNSTFLVSTSWLEASVSGKSRFPSTIRVLHVPVSRSREFEESRQAINNRLASALKLTLVADNFANLL